MLEVSDLSVSYGRVTAVRDISFKVGDGEMLTIVGPNGAGKSSILGAIAGIEAGVATGSVRVDGTEILGSSPERIARLGVNLVPEGRRIFAGLTVAENLEMGMSTRRDRAAAAADRERILERFPALTPALDRHAGVLSGGQQQMLALARGLLTSPRVLLLDEPSFGLAPLLVDEVFRIIEELRSEGLAILLLEQNALKAVAVADRALLIRQGKVEPVEAGLGGERLLSAYFGLTASAGAGGTA